MLVLTNEYYEAPVKLIILDQETLGVETPLSTIPHADDADFDQFVKRVEAEFSGFDFALGSRWERTPFWTGFQEACDAFGLKSRRDAAWSNVAKVQTIGAVKGGVSINALDPQVRAEIVKWQRPIALAEIAYAQPDAILLFTGDLTWIAENTFRSTVDWTLRTDLAKGQIGELPATSGTLTAPLLDSLPVAYTYHPNALRTAEDKAKVREHRTTVIRWLTDRVANQKASLPVDGGISASNGHQPQ
ncbi:hypothetical protein [Shinella sp.]|uniref:hypothetical protein n=1 Tax=Shinella sp. TaxID=1870904 RepID=UPI0040372DFE